MRSFTPPALSYRSVIGRQGARPSGHDDNSRSPKGEISAKFHARRTFFHEQPPAQPPAEPAPAVAGLPPDPCTAGGLSGRRGGPGKPAGRGLGRHSIRHRLTRHETGRPSAAGALPHRIEQGPGSASLVGAHGFTAPHPPDSRVIRCPPTACPPVVNTESCDSWDRFPFRPNRRYPRVSPPVAPSSHARSLRPKEDVQ